MKLHITVQWTRYTDFFDLWDAHKKATQLLYVIGERDLCYIGCIGINGGKTGLGQRYQKQYMDRSKAIFGMQRPIARPAFAGVFTAPNRLLIR